MRRISCWLLVAVCGLWVCTGVVAGTAPEPAAPSCGTNVTYTGSGTIDDSYLVSNVSQLQCIPSHDPAARYELTADIDASATRWWHNGSGFEPLGSTATPFTGTLAGNGSVITGLYIDRNRTAPVGLIGYGERAHIQAVTVTNATVYGHNTTGILVGQNREGTITDANTSGTVAASHTVGGLVGWNNGTIASATTQSVVRGRLWSVGGLVGQNHGRIQCTVASGSVTGHAGWRATYDTAGLAAVNTGTIRYAAAHSRVNGSTYVGGLVSHNTGIIDQSSATGTVTGSGTLGGLVGRPSVLVDRAQPLDSPDGLARLIASRLYNQVGVGDSYWDTTTTGQRYSSGSPPSHGLPTTAMTGENATTHMSEFDFTTGWQTQPDGYPTLRSSCPAP